MFIRPMPSADPPAFRDVTDAFLPSTRHQREASPDRASRWTLIPDPRLEPGECRVRAGGREADAGCRQRLAACMEQVSAQLLPQTGEVEA